MRIRIEPIALGRDLETCLNSGNGIAERLPFTLHLMDLCSLLLLLLSLSFCGGIETKRPAITGRLESEYESGKLSKVKFDRRSDLHSTVYRDFYF